jgi:hypothetical protein
LGSHPGQSGRGAPERVLARWFQMEHSSTTAATHALRQRFLGGEQSPVFESLQTDEDLSKRHVTLE